MDKLNQLRQMASDSANESLLDNTLASSDSNLGYQTANESSSSKYFSFIEDDSPSAKGILDGSDSNKTLIGSEKIVEDQEDILSDMPAITKPDLLKSYKIDNEIDAANILSGGVEIFDENENSYDENELIIDDNPCLVTENQLDDNKISEDNNLKPGLLTKKGSDKMLASESNLTAEDVLKDTLNKASLCSEPSVITAEFANGPDLQISTNEIILQIDGKNLDAIDIGNGLFLYRKEGEEELTAIQITPGDDGSPQIKFLKVRHNEDDNLEVYEEQITEVPIINETVEKEAAVTNDEIIVEPKAHLPIKDLNKVIGCADIMAGSKTVALDKRTCTAGFDKIIVLQDEFDGKRDKKQSNEIESSQKDSKSHISDRTEHIFATGLKMNDLNFTKTSQLAKAKAEIGIIAKTDLFKVDSKGSTELNVKISISTEVDKKSPTVSNQPAADQSKFKTIRDVKDKESSIFELCKKKSVETGLDEDLLQESLFDSLNDSVDLEESALKGKISGSPNILDCCIEKVKVLPVSPLRLPVPVVPSSPFGKTKTLRGEAETNEVGEIDNIESPLPKLTQSVESVESVLDQLLPKECTEPVTESVSDFKDNETIHVSDIVIQQSEGKVFEVNIHTKNAIPSNAVAIKEKHCEASNKIIGNELSTIFITGKIDVDEDFSGTKMENDKTVSNDGNNSYLKTGQYYSEKQEKIPEVVEKLNTAEKKEQDILKIEVKDSTKLPVEQFDKAPLKNKNKQNLRKSCDNDDVILVEDVCTNGSKSDSCRRPVKSDVSVERVTKVLNFLESENKEVDEASKGANKTKAISEIIQIAEETFVKNTLLPSLAVAGKDKIIDLTDDNHVIESDVSLDIKKQSTPKSQKGFEKSETKIEDAIIKLNKMADSKPASVERLVTSIQDITFKSNFGKTGDSKIMKTSADSLQIVNLTLEKSKLGIPFHINKKETTPTKKPESKLERLLRPETAVTLDSNTKNRTNDNNREFEKSNFSRKSYYQKFPEMVPTKLKGSSIKETVGIDLVKVSREKPKSNPSLQLGIDKNKPTSAQSSLQLTKHVESSKALKEIKNKTPEKPTQTEQIGNDEDKFVYDDNYISEALNMKSISTDPDYNEFAGNTSILPSTASYKLKDPFAEERKINNKKQEITDVYKNLTGSKYPCNIPGKNSSHTASSGILKDFGKTQPSNWFTSTNKLSIPHSAPVEVTIANKLVQNIKAEKIIEGKVRNQIKEVDVIVLDDDSERYSEEEVLECEPVTGDVDFRWLQGAGDVTKEKNSTVQGRLETPRNDSPVKLSNYETKSKKVIVETTELGRELNVDATNLPRAGTKIVDAPNKSELDDKNANAVITEVDFDKFVRRNSTHRYEDCIAVELQNEKPNIVHRIIESDVQDVNKLQTETRVPNNILIPNDVNKQGKLNSVQNITQNNTFSVKCAKKVYPGRKSNLPEESGRAQPVSPDKNIPANVLLYGQLNQNSSGVHKMSHPNKFQKAYQSALSTKNRNNLNHVPVGIEQPITAVITDPTTKDLISVVSGSNPGGPQSTNQDNSIAIETITKLTTQTDKISVKELSSGNPPLKSNPHWSDDDKLGTMQRQRTKQPRKQVLSPVESSDIEMIFSNSDMNDSSKGNKPRKRKPDYPLPKLSSEILQDKAKEDEKLSNILPKKKILARASAFSENIIEKDVSLNKTEKTDGTGNSIRETDKTDGTGNSLPKKGRGRPRKSIIPVVSNQENLKDTTAEIEPTISGSPIKDDDIVRDANTFRENWTMGKINENMRCPICSKIFRSENVVFKHVKHCSGVCVEKEDGEVDSDNVYQDESMSEQPLIMEKIIFVPEKVDKHESDEKDKGKEELSVKYDNKTLVNRDALKRPKSKLDKITAYAKSLKPSHDSSVSLSCEMCGKTFRQLSSLISHKLTHTENDVKSEPVRIGHGTASALSCEICKKSFRKLYHLVQHREMHHTPKNVLEKQGKLDDVKQEQMITDRREVILTTPLATVNVEVKSVKTSQDQKTVGFRCEACDKSFRKLHHLVEHRETHDGAGRLNMPLSPSTTGSNLPLPKCDICSKTFRKLHLMIEHKKQHSTLSEDESSESALDNLPRLLAKDIIHECSICYMVFPNEHSLNKHSASCLRKRNSKGVRQSTDNATISDAEQKDSGGEEDRRENLIQVRSSPVKRSISNDNASCTQLVVPKKIHKPIETLSQLTPKTNVKNSRISRRLGSIPLPLAKSKHEEEVKDDEIRYKINPLYKPKSDLDSDDQSISGDSDNVPLRDIPKMPLVNTSRRRTIPTKRISGKIELKSKNSEKKQTPKLKLTQGFIAKRTPKISKYKEKKILSTVSSIVNRIKSVDSNIDDDSIKYSFPKKLKGPATVKSNETKKNSVASSASPTVRSDLRKIKTPTKTKKDKPGESLSGVKKVKTPSKPAPFKLPSKCCGQTFASQITLAEHRKDHKKPPLRLTHLCDCGEVFSSAALLARHTTLSHTPPRIRRSRLFAAVPVAKTQQQNVVKKEAGTVMKRVKKKIAHSGVPLPESARRALVSDKL